MLVQLPFREMGGGLLTWMSRSTEYSGPSQHRNNRAKRASPPPMSTGPPFRLNKETPLRNRPLVPDHSSDGVISKRESQPNPHAHQHD